MSLNLRNIPGGMISGLSTNELEWVSIESCDRFLSELSPSFFDDMEAENMIEEYSTLDRDITVQMDDLEKELTPKGTQHQTISHIRKFKTFLESKKLSTNIEAMPVRFLADYLRYFYFSLRCKDGSFYAPRSLVGIRASVHRYLTSSDVNRQVNILKDPEFSRANAVLKAMVGKWIHEGNKAKSYPAIEPSDMTKIRGYFTRTTPNILQQEIWFNCVLYFGLRGREVLSFLKKNDIDFDVDSDGHEFVRIKNEFLTKTVKKSLSQKEFENISVARMYANSDCPSECPVNCFRLYLSKIPDTNSHLFAMPNINFNSSSKSWYTNSRNVGKDALGKFMKIISHEAQLSKIYTNHCVRVTVVSELHQQGFKNSEIAQITGHKNSESVERYIRQTRDEGRRKLSNALSRGFSVSNSQMMTCAKKREHVEVSFYIIFLNSIFRLL